MEGVCGPFGAPDPARGLSRAELERAGILRVLERAEGQAPGRGGLDLALGADGAGLRGRAEVVHRFDPTWSGGAYLEARRPWIGGLEVEGGVGLRARW